MSGNRYPVFGILLVDDEPSFLRSFTIVLERNAGINHIYTCQDSRDVMAMLDREPIGMVLLDLTMPHLSGTDLLHQIVEKHPEIAVIVISGLNQLETALHCLRIGAHDYFVKTTEEDRIIEGIRRAIRIQEMQLENQEISHRLLNDTLELPEAFDGIITQDKAMRSVFQYLESIRASRQPVLICGESGVGKELIAQAVHKVSRRSGPLVCVNSAGLDDNMFADALFGHTRGAYTGADSTRAGYIEQAANGTLFLDEIGDLSLASQIKLLRLLQEGEYYPLGSDRPKRLQARMVFATHQDLAKKQQAGEFRKDLYYRIRIHQVEIPPLRKRPGDIPLLLDLFLDEAAAELGKSKPTLPRELPVLLSAYRFPGNVRELRALAFEAMSRHRSHVLSMENFRKLLDSPLAEGAEPQGAGESRMLFNPDQPLPTLQEANDMLIREAMQRARGNQSIASRMLGISQPALSKRLKKSPADDE